MRSVKSKKTYKEWLTWLTKILTPNKHRNPELIEFVCDTYCSISSKSCTLTEKGEFASKYDNWKKLGGIFSQYKEWKRSLQFICHVYQKNFFRDISDVSVVIANNVESWFVTDQYVEKVFESYHETRMNLHALYKKINAVIVFKNTCVLVLLAYMYTLENITSKRCMKTSNDKFIDIGKRVDY